VDPNAVGGAKITAIPGGAQTGMTDPKAVAQDPNALGTGKAGAQPIGAHIGASDPKALSQDPNALGAGKAAAQPIGAQTGTTDPKALSQDPNAVGAGKAGAQPAGTQSTAPDPKQGAASGQQDPKSVPGQQDPKTVPGQQDPKTIAGQQDPKVPGGSVDPMVPGAAGVIAALSDPKSQGGAQITSANSQTVTPAKEQLIGQNSSVIPQQTAQGLPGSQGTTPSGTVSAGTQQGSGQIGPLSGEAQIVRGESTDKSAEPTKSADTASKLQEAKERKEKDDAARLREDKEREQQRKQELDEQSKRDAIALMAARRSKEEAEAAKQQAERIRAEKAARELLIKKARRKYLVRAGDSVESIAQKMLYDKRLALLIIKVNDPPQLIVVPQENKKHVHLKCEALIWLPSIDDVEKFKKNPPKKDQFEYVFHRAEKAVVPISTLTATPVLLGRPQYTVRLGDTLKSVAMRHPALGDVSLWRLLAQVNEMPTTVDERGVPIAALIRGTVIGIPLPQEVEEFRNQHKGAPVLPASSIPIERRRRARSEKDKTSVQQFIQQLGDTTRVVRRTVSGAFQIYTVRLEIKQDGSWLPVVAYDVKPNGSIRHEYKLDGSVQSQTIDLPNDAANEMAKADIKKNWHDYVLLFVGTRRNA
jgi:hypothetical protein